MPATPPAAARAGADEELAALFATHHLDVLRLAYLLCGDRDRAEDIVADAFAKLYPRLCRGAVANPPAYLRRAVVNGSNSRFRRLALERREQARARGDGRGHRAAEEQVVDAHAVAQALATLPPRQRSAVVLRYYADLPEREVAALLGVTIGTVKSSVSRALERLRPLLSEGVM